MVYEFKLPDIGEGLTEAELVEWLVKEGDYVKEHQAIAKMETDKAVAELPSPKSGKILRLNFKPGDTVNVGDVVVVLDDGTGGVAQAAVPEKAEKTVFKPAGAVGYLEEAQAVEEKVCNVCSAKFKTESELDNHVKSMHQQKSQAPSQVLATPAVRKLASELGVELRMIRGTGQQGMVIEADVRKAAGQAKKTEDEPQIKTMKKYDFYGYIDHIPLKGIRKATAAKMTEAKDHIPAVTVMDDVDITSLWKLREGQKAAAMEKGIKLTFLPYVIKALIASLQEYPNLNSSLDEENQEIIVKKYYNIGIAVDTGDGLIVPVVKVADTKDILQLAKEIQDLAEKARRKEIDLGDLKGGTFTITNYGSIGTTYGTPIINYPECAVLGLGRIFDKPVIVDNKLRIVKTLPLSLTFDHRIVDGAYAARFMKLFVEKLSAPEGLK